MQELIQHLCRSITAQLQAQPQMPTADLVTATLAQIAGDEQLNKEIERQSRSIQINTGNATGYQTILNGGIAYIGEHYHVNESVAKAAIELLLKELKLPIDIPHNINRSGSQHFVGRDDELWELDRMLQTSRQIAVTAVQGMGGVGKTELALQYAWEQLKAETHSGGVCWLQGRENVGGQIELFAQIHLGLSVPEEIKNKHPADRVEYYWGHWREGEVLVVIDDVLDYAAIKKYLPPLDGRFKVLLTTRLELGSGIQRLPLGVLELEEAVALLRGLIGAKRVDADLDDAKSLCEWLGRLPLGIELVGRYLARNQTLTLAKMQERLNDKRLAAQGLIKSKLDVAMTATHESLAAAFELSWEDLDNELIFAAPVRRYARQLGALLSVFAVAPIVWQWVVDCLPEWDEEDLEVARDEGLVGSHLLQVNNDRTYQLHPMIREFFDVKLQLYERKPQGCLIRLVQKFLTVQQDLMSVKEEIQHSFKSVILTEAKRVSEQPETSLIVECSLVIPHLQELVKQGEETGAEEVTSSGLSYLSNLYYAMGRYSEAEFFGLRNLTINEKFGADHLLTAQSLGNLAEFYRKTGRYDEGEKLFVRAIAIYERENEPSIVISLNNLALLYCTLGRYDDSEQLYNQSLSIAKQRLFAYPIYTTFSLTGLANIYESKGWYELAENLNNESLKIREELLGEDHILVADCLNNLANTYASTGRYELAKEYYERSFQIRENQLGRNHPETAQSMNNLAYIYTCTDRDRYREAESLYKESLKIRENMLGINHIETAESLHNLGCLYYLEDNYPQAEPLLVRALAIRKLELVAEHRHTQDTQSLLYYIWRNYDRK